MGGRLSVSDDFTPVVPTGKPTWTDATAPESTFTTINVSELENVEEVGYDEGGYSEGGFDAPSVTYPGAAMPTWTDVTDR